MVAKKRYNASEIFQILLESSDESSVVDSESELESTLSDFEESDGNESAETVIYDVGSDFAWCDRPYNQPTRLDLLDLLDERQ